VGVTQAVSFDQQRSRAAYPTPGAVRQRQGKQHHCLSVRHGLCRQSVGTVLLHPAKALGVASLRIVLAKQ